MGSSVVLRSWSRADLPAMAGLINDRVAADGGEDEPITEAAITAMYEHLGTCDPERDIVVATGSAGDVRGYARAIRRDLADGVRTYALAFEGHPDVRGRMFEWAVTRAQELAAADPHPQQHLEAGAADGTDRARIAEAGGFVPYAWSAVMVRPTLAEVPDLALPDDVAVRAVEPDDLRAIWEADVEAFRDHNHQLAQVGEDEWEQFLEEEVRLGTEWWQVAWDSDGVVGQVRTRVVPGEAERRGRRRAWTENISTRRDRRGQGVASALIAASLHQLAAAGFDEAALGVDLENPTGALAVYERLGYRVVQRYTGYRRPVDSAAALRVS